MTGPLQVAWRYVILYTSVFVVIVGLGILLTTVNPPTPKQHLRGLSDYTLPAPDRDDYAVHVRRPVVRDSYTPTPITTLTSPAPKKSQNLPAKHTHRPVRPTAAPTSATGTATKAPTVTPRPRPRATVKVNLPPLLPHVRISLPPLLSVATN